GAQPLVREARELQLVDVAVRRPDQERAAVGHRGVLRRRQVGHLDLARHAQHRNPDGVRALLRRLDGLLVGGRLAERPPHEGRDEPQDRQGQHHLDEGEAAAGRALKRPPAHQCVSPPFIRLFIGLPRPAPLAAPAPLAPLAPPVPVAAAWPNVLMSALAGSVRYWTTSKLWLRRPCSSQMILTVTLRIDS